MQVAFVTLGPAASPMTPGADAVNMKGIDWDRIATDGGWILCSCPRRVPPPQQALAVTLLQPAMEALMRDLLSDYPVPRQPRLRPLGVWQLASPAAEVERDLPGLEGLARDQLELSGLVEPVEQPRPAPGQDRVDHQPVFVD